jgi:hypothetical protein
MRENGWQFLLFLLLLLLLLLLMLLLLLLLMLIHLAESPIVLDSDCRCGC